MACAYISWLYFFTRFSIYLIEKGSVTLNTAGDFTAINENPSQGSQEMRGRAWRNSPPWHPLARLV
jgi:hypothetical protein